LEVCVGCCIEAEAEAAAAALLGPWASLRGGCENLVDFEGVLLCWIEGFVGVAPFMAAFPSEDGLVRLPDFGG